MLLTGNARYAGLTMDRVLAQRTRGKPAPDLLDAFFELLAEEGGSVPTIYEHHAEKDMQLALQQPWCGIGSDGLAYAVEGPLRRGGPPPPRPRPPPPRRGADGRPTRPRRPPC